jgi:hypothetical protein
VNGVTVLTVFGPALVLATWRMRRDLRILLEQNRIAYEALARIERLSAHNSPCKAIARRALAERE